MAFLPDQRILDPLISRDSLSAAARPAKHTVGPSFHGSGAPSPLPSYLKRGTVPHRRGSGAAHEQVRDKLDLAFEDLGEQSVKNIARPVRVYRVRDDRAADRSRSKLASPVLPLPDKPSIAVLPFANMSGGPEQDYFADGMVEEIITALSRVDLSGDSMRRRKPNLPADQKN
jgi:hypothetical protein